MKKLLIAMMLAFAAAVTFAAASTPSTPADKIYKKANVEQGICYYTASDMPIGTASVKFSALNKTKKTLKVTMTITPFSGKKQTASKTVTPDEYGNISDTLSFKKSYGTVNFRVNADYWTDGDCESGCWYLDWEASNDSIFVESTYMGGIIYYDKLAFSVDAGELELPEGYDLVVDPPEGQEFRVKNHKKFEFDKAPSISYKKKGSGKDVWYELSGLDDSKKPNIPALKLTYNYKTGIVTGSFKIYASNEGSIASGKKPTLKKYTAKVNAALLWGGEMGVGVAALKVGKTTFNLPVSIWPLDYDCEDCFDYSDDSDYEERGKEVSPSDIGGVAYETGTGDDTTPGESPETFTWPF